MLIKSRGATQLCSSDSIAGAAKRTGLSKRAVIAHRNGDTAPSPQAREIYARAYNIGADSWDTMAPPTSPVGDASPGLPRSAPLADGASAKARVEAQIADLRALRDGGSLTGKARLECERLLQTAHRDLARLEGAALTERQISASPHFERLLGRIVAAVNRESVLAVLAVTQATGLLALEEGSATAEEVALDGAASVEQRFPDLVAACRGADAALRAALKPSRA